MVSAMSETFQAKCAASGWRLSLPSSGWSSALRQLPIRDPDPEIGEEVISAQAREVSALTSGNRRWLAVALAEMPDLSILEVRLGSCHLRLVVLPNGQESYERRMVGENRRRRIEALGRRIAKDQAELKRLRGRRTQAVDEAVDGGPDHPY